MACSVRLEIDKLGLTLYFPWSFLGYNCCFGFRHVKVYCNSDNALAGLIREIRDVSLYVPGFQSCELEEFVYVASTF